MHKLQVYTVWSQSNSEVAFLKDLLNEHKFRMNVYATKMQVHKSKKSSLP